MSGEDRAPAAGTDFRARFRIRAYLGAFGAILGFTAIHFVGTDLYFGYRMRFRLPDERMASHGELAFLYYGLIIGLPSIALGAWGLANAESAWPVPFARLRDFFRRLSPREHPRTAASIGLLAASAAIVATRLWVYHQRVVTNDEYYYQFDAKLIQSGRLSLQISPVLGQFFPSFQAVLWNGRFFSKYFVGHSAVLAAGRAVGVGNWTVPLLSIAALVPFGVFVRRAFGERACGATLLFVAASPLYVLVGATTLSQPTVIFFFSYFLVAWIAYRSSQIAGSRWLPALGMGVFAALMGMARPISAVGLVAPILLAEAVAQIRVRKRGFALDVAAFAGPAAVGVLVLLAVNAAQNGNPLRTAYSLHRFPLDRIMSFTHASDWRHFIENVGITFGRLNWAQLGWPVSLLFLPWAFRSGVVARILGGSALGFFLANHLTPSPGIDPVGPEHFAELAPLLALFSALGVLQLLDRFPDSEAAIRSTICLLVAYELAVFAPQRVSNLKRYVRQANRVSIMAERAKLHHAVVFASRAPYPWLSASPDSAGRRLFPWPMQPGEPDLNRAFLQARMSDRGAGFSEYGDDNLPVPDPDLRDDVIFLNDFGPADAMAMDRLPGRTAYALVLASPQTLELHLLRRPVEGMLLEATPVASTAVDDPDVMTP